jgi:hypothetical protein
MNTQDIFQEELRKFEKHVVKSVESIFEADGEVYPVVFALLRVDKKFSIGILGGLGELFCSEEGKEKAAEIIKNFGETSKPLAIAFASESWMTELTKGEKLTTMPSKDPRRVEIVHISFESFNQTGFHCWEILREGSLLVKEVSLKKREDISTTWKMKDGKMVGRFMNLLEENYTDFSDEMRTFNLN